MALLHFSPSADPVSSLLTLQRELERTIENPLGLNLGFSGRGVFPAVNIFGDKEGCVVRLEVPGVSPDQITIEAQGLTLTVAGTRDSTAPAGSAFHRRERDSGAFARSLQLPDDFDVARTEASYAHGLLTLRVPKKEAAKPRQISVKAA
ncbi:MAG: Hsp20/alpha crystallin family protein [candidate division NC10 bacterium]|nr:Hsp20/alpha crystallin family protein [candidate division NC10 bacterium]